MKRSKLLAILCIVTVFVQSFTIFPINVAAADPVNVEFYYNYTGAPAARPVSFTKTTGTDGKLESFPVEQTLPQVGSRADYGFVGWYTNAEGTGEKVTPDTVLTADTSLYAKWEQVPSLFREFEDYFLMGAFQNYSNTTNAQWNKHYNVLCPSNDFKLTNQINVTTMRNNFVAARTAILANTELSDAEKKVALQKASEQVVLGPGTNVQNYLNNLRAWNAANPDNKKYTRFHVIAWHGGQQPGQFFTTGFAALANNQTAYNNSLLLSRDLTNAALDGAPATRDTMKARLDNYIRLVMEKYSAYKDIIISWDVINEPVDDFTGQIRNTTDSNSQLGQWGFIWHDGDPARNQDGSLKYTTTPDATGKINDYERLYDESEWMRVAIESSAKWSKEFGCDWALYVNDYMDSNKLYTKLQPTLDITKWISDEVDLKGINLGWGMQGRLAWAYPTIDTLRKQVEDGLAICDEMGVTEADVRSDFEPNPFYDPTQRTRPILQTDTPQWVSGDLNSGSGSWQFRSTLINTFDTHNSPVRRIPEWGTGNGLASGSARYNCTSFLPISEAVMKKQADFAADWMDILVENSDKVAYFQWDGYSDSNTFNGSKGAHMWVNNVTGRPGVFEKYSFFAVIGSPARDKLKKAIAANPALSDAGKYIDDAAWTNYTNALSAAIPLLNKRIYTLEGVNDVKDATKALNNTAALLNLIDPVTVEFYYNYTGAPVARPASFTKQTAPGGLLSAFPVEQTLPQVGSRADFGFVGWYKNPEGTGDKVTLDSVFTTNTNLYAKWEQVPSLFKEFEDYFLMGAFQNYSSTTNAHWNKHYNILCPINDFKLTNQINVTTMRNNYVAARTAILANEALSDLEKSEALQKASEQVVLGPGTNVQTFLNNLRAWNTANPDNKKYARFHVVAWHGGQQPGQFFTTGFAALANNQTAYNNSLLLNRNLMNASLDGAPATRETMKARLDNYIRLVMQKYSAYKDIIISWDIINEPVDDFSGQIRNTGDSNSQLGQWGFIWRDGDPARNPDGSLKYTTMPDATGKINDDERLYDESEWMRVAIESAAKWSREYGCDWALYVNDYMDSNKLYTKLQPTLDITKWISDEVDLKGINLGWGMQGRLAWAYPTIDMLRKQVEDGLAICDEMGVTEADVRSDFEPNPFYDPTQRTRPVLQTDTPQWVSGDVNSGSGNWTIRSTLMNTFDTHNSPVRRIPEWGTGNGLAAGSARYNCTSFLPISEAVMKKQADFTADWMDILVENSDKVEYFQWDGYSDSNTFNSSKGAHIWVNNVTGRTGIFEKYSFFAAIGAPARDQLKKAVDANPALTDSAKYLAAPTAWASYAKALNTATALLGKRIYTLEGVNDVKDATRTLSDAAALLEATCTLLTYNANGGSGSNVREGYTPGANAPVKTDASLRFKRSGYTFGGWNTSANGSGTSYDGGATVKMDNNITLYAQWAAIPVDFTVAFENYSDTEVASVAVAAGDRVPKPSDPERAGCIFAGWYRDISLTNPWDFDTDTVSGNMKLHAKWDVEISFKYDSLSAVAAKGIVPGRTLIVGGSLASDSAPQTMIVALYDAKGKLIKNVSGNGFIVDDRMRFKVDFAIPAEVSEGSLIKVFVWNTDTFAPVRKVVNFSSNSIFE